MLFQVQLPHVPVRLKPCVCSFAFEPLNVYHPFLFTMISTISHFTLTKQECPPCPYLINAGRRASLPHPHCMNTSSNNIYSKRELHKVSLMLWRSTHTQVTCWPFPAFYRSHMGQLIYQCALFIKLWGMRCTCNRC